MSDVKREESFVHRLLEPGLYNIHKDKATAGTHSALDDPLTQTTASTRKHQSHLAHDNPSSYTTHHPHHLTPQPSSPIPLRPKPPHPNNTTTNRKRQPHDPNGDFPCKCPMLLAHSVALLPHPLPEHIWRRRAELSDEMAERWT